MSEPQLINAREIDWPRGWSAWAFSLDSENETTIGVGFGETREDAAGQAKEAWRQEREHREREAALLALAGEEPRRRRKR